MTDPIANIKRLYFTVTPDDIRLGLKCNPRYCPTAYAARRALNAKIKDQGKILIVNVDIATLEVVYFKFSYKTFISIIPGARWIHNHPAGFRYCRFNFSMSACKFINAFDSRYLRHVLSPHPFYAHKKRVTFEYALERARGFGYAL